VERARLYLQRMDGAVSGQGGHDQTFRAARTLVVDFDLDTETALKLLLSDFNPRCTPPWSERELRHKVNSAQKLSSPRGKLLQEPRRVELPERYAAQLRAAQHKKDLLLTREHAAPRIQQAIREALAEVGAIYVIVVPCSGGKTYNALEVVRTWNHGKLALLVKEHDLAEDIRRQATVMGIEAARHHSPIGEGGPRKPPTQGQVKGDLLCDLAPPVVQAHIQAGGSGPGACRGCPRFGSCSAQTGRIGPENAKLHIAPDQSPNFATQHAEYLLKDEWPELLSTYRATLEGLRLLALGDESLMPKTRKVLQQVALAVLGWFHAGMPSHIDPLAPYREALAELLLQDDGKKRPELARDPDYRPHRKLQFKGAHDHHAAWQAGITLLRAAEQKQSFTFQSDAQGPALVFYEKSPVAKALSQAKSAVILTATPGDIQALERMTGKKVVVVHIPLQNVAPIEFTWQPSTNATRRAYHDGHGRPRFWAEKKTSLAQHIQDATKGVLDRPQITGLLIGTYRFVAVGIRLAWARFRNVLPDKDDEKSWAKLHGTEAENALQKALRVLAPLFAILTERNITLEVIHYHAGAGLNRWREEGTTFNAAITLGNPNPQVEEHRKRYAFMRGIPDEELPDNDPDWQKAYDLAAANEATQIHGRIGDAGRPEGAFTWHLHIGKTLPSDWNETTAATYRPQGRPRQEEPSGLAFDWREALEEARQSVGSAPKLAQRLGIDLRTLQRYLSGERTPTTAVLDRLQEEKGLATGGCASVPVTEITIASSLNSNFGHPPPPDDWLNLPEMTIAQYLSSNFGKTPPRLDLPKKTETTLDPSRCSNLGKTSEEAGIPPVASPTPGSGSGVDLGRNGESTERDGVETSPLGLAQPSRGDRAG
jgi:transcriptional regulator with XRE-family HTH domain